MANEEHLAILKQGVVAWTLWRIENPEIQPSLDGADLTGLDLEKTDLRGANLSGATFGEVLHMTNFSGADLSRANLAGNILVGANLSGADLTEANLSWADLSGAILDGANLSKANLRGASLIDASVNWVNLSETIFDEARVGMGMFIGVDLSTIKGLDTVTHVEPSIIDTETIYRSKGQIPKAFLRGCGVPDSMIEFAKLYREGLSTDEINTILHRIHDLRAGQPIQISPLFISYSHSDGTFVDVMEEHLDDRGIRFWRDVHHATAGRLETQIDRAIRHNPTVLLILSENSVQSDWVQHEARLARRLEIETERDVLCPVALDDSWKTCRWPERLREQIMEYNILDFSDWEDEHAFERMFGRLIDGLDLFYE